MLIFDNIIFSTFIPQILMFLGFVTCVSASYLYPAQDADKEITIESKLAVTVADNVSHGETFLFTDHQYFSNSVATPADNSNPFIPHISRYNYPLVSFSLTSYGVDFPHVTRPPPFYCRFA